MTLTPLDSEGAAERVLTGHFVVDPSGGRVPLVHLGRQRSRPCSCTTNCLREQSRVRNRPGVCPVDSAPKIHRSWLGQINPPASNEFVATYHGRNVKVAR
jgi:hypothetical protein